MHKIAIDIKLDRKEISSYVISFWRTSPVAVLLIFLLLAAILAKAQVFSFLIFPNEMPDLIPILACYVIGIPLILYLMHLKVNRVKDVSVLKYEFTEEKISIVGDMFKREHNWADIFRIIDFKRWIIILPAFFTFFIIPKAFLTAAEFNEFAELAKMKIGKKYKTVYSSTKKRLIVWVVTLLVTFLFIWAVFTKH